MPNICNNVTVYQFADWGYTNYIKMNIDYSNTPISNGMRYTFNVTLDCKTYSSSYYNPEIYVELRFSDGTYITDNSNKLFKGTTSGLWIRSKSYTKDYTGTTAPKLEVTVYSIAPGYSFSYGWHAFPEGSGTLDFITVPNMTSCSIVEKGYNYLKIHWTANKNVDKASYRLYHDGNWDGWHDLDASGTSGDITINNLDFYKEYTIKVHVHNSAGWSMDNTDTDTSISVDTTRGYTWGAFMYIKQGNIWKKCLVWYKDSSGNWIKTKPYYKVGNNWKISIRE